MKPSRRVLYCKTCKCYCGCHPCRHTPPKDSWEGEFFERFGANKIWVKPTKENVDTILEIHAFIATHIEQAYDRGAEEATLVCNENIKKANAALDTIITLINNEKNVSRISKRKTRRAIHRN